MKNGVSYETYLWEKGVALMRISSEIGLWEILAPTDVLPAIYEINGNNWRNGGIGLACFRVSVSAVESNLVLEARSNKAVYSNLIILT